MSAPIHTYALILAGGSGTRFWPLSRDAQPKQLLDLFGSGTLLEQTINRLNGLVPLSNILILTNQKQLASVQKIASMLPPENILAEPTKRDTAPAIALGTALIAAKDPNATMLVLPSDQLIQDTEAFQSVISDAISAAQSGNHLVTIGIQPTWPCPSYGYIERGEAIPSSLTHPPFTVSRFREKPSPEVAEEFLRQGNFSWNAGMFIWTIPTICSQFQKHAPELAAFVEQTSQSPSPLSEISATFPQLTPLSIDYAIMEKADSVINIEATFDWDDVGSWISIAKYLPSYGNQNHSNQNLIEINSNHNITYSSTPNSQMTLLGVNHLIVVQTPDALLIADRNQADAIKNLTPLLPPHLL